MLCCLCCGCAVLYCGMPCCAVILEAKRRRAQAHGVDIECCAVACCAVLCCGVLCCTGLMMMLTGRL
jgi:hypothetical protein